jgi:hypothetical protein
MADLLIGDSPNGFDDNRSRKAANQFADASFLGPLMFSDSYQAEARR